VAKPSKLVRIYDDTDVKIERLKDRYKTRSTAETVDLLIGAIGNWNDLDRLFGYKRKKG
jgi:hypothetical protein